MVEGNGDWSLLWTTTSSLALFTGFGLMGMSSAYDWHNTRHMRLIEVLIERLKAQDANNKTMIPPLVEEQGETHELSRKEIPITSGTSASEQEEHRRVEEGTVSYVHDAISDRELVVSTTESISGE